MVGHAVQAGAFGVGAYRGEGGEAHGVDGHFFVFAVEAGHGRGVVRFLGGGGGDGRRHGLLVWHRWGRVKILERGNLFEVVCFFILFPKVVLADSGNLGLYEATASP